MRPDPIAFFGLHCPSPDSARSSLELASVYGNRLWIDLSPVLHPFGKPSPVTTQSILDEAARASSPATSQGLASLDSRALVPEYLHSDMNQDMNHSFRTCSGLSTSMADLQYGEVDVFPAFPAFEYRDTI